MHQILCSWILYIVYVVHNVFCASMNIVLYDMYTCGFPIIVAVMCTIFCVVRFCALFMLCMIYFVFWWTLCSRFCALWHLSTWFCVARFYELQLFDMGFCVMWRILCMKVCVFLCSIMRYDIIDDIEAITLIKSCKIWKMD